MEESRRAVRAWTPSGRAPQAPVRSAEYLEWVAMVGDRLRAQGRAPTSRTSSMELFDTTQIGLERALSGASLRQQAIAQNIANVNTPGYRRQDVDFQSALH